MNVGYGDIQYNQDHRPAGIGDNTGANKPRTLKVQQIPKISVTWNKETDSTEIHMEEEEEPEPPTEPQQSSRKRDFMKLLQFNN